MTKMIKRIIFFLLFMSSILLHSQTEEIHDEESESDNPVLEIIISGIFASSFEHQETTFGTEFHITYWFNHEWGGGISYTLKYEDEETLNDIALLGSWNPTKWITLNVGPNFGFSGEHRDFEVSGYAEAEFNIRPRKWIHFGPLIGAVLGANSEYTLGMHLGFEF